METLGHLGQSRPAAGGRRSALRMVATGRATGPRPGDGTARPLTRSRARQGHARGGSLTSVQSSIPGTTGGDADCVVSVRPLLGENQTYSAGDSAPSGSASAISGPDVPLSFRSAFLARLASCLALR